MMKVDYWKSEDSSMYMYRIVFFLSSFGINHLKMIAPRAIVPRVIIQEMFWTFILTLYILW